jgi:ATP-dependent helicase/DNAse subunit B
MRRNQAEAAPAIAASCPHFRRSRDAARRRWSRELTVYDGLVNPLPADLALRLDPTTAGPISASRLATFAQCGFRYLLQHVLRLQPTPEPEERLALSPLERGDLFHRVAEKFLRERRERRGFPVRDDADTRRRLRELADAELEALAAKSPPLFTALWERECESFRALLLSWLRREADPRSNTTPMHFEVGFGPNVPPTEGEPHLAAPVEIDLNDGRVLRVSGRIDRIDRAADGTLVLRDYKTGKAPRDDGRVFRGGGQLQIPFYVLAAARLFPGQRVSRAFLDYVNGGRDVALDLDAVRGEGFAALLREMAGTIGAGIFVQEPSACTWCDFKAVCGPQPHLELKRVYKKGDRRLLRVLALREVR